MRFAKCLAWWCLIVLLVGCSHHPTQPSQPFDPKTTHGQDDPSTDIDYSVEAYRVVGDKDLVCTVLKNGLTIIAKRIASPVISVQGLCHTGSIYEGKWLGGGLSHGVPVVKPGLPHCMGVGSPALGLPAATGGVVDMPISWPK